MQNLVNRFVLIASLSCSCMFMQAEEKKPLGLMTDLIEHTERTWQNGYASTVRVWDLNTAIEPLQYAAIRSTHPAFSWIVPGNKQNTCQIAYQIIVSDSKDEIENEKGNVWDSGIVNSNQSVAVNYSGEALKPNKTYFWRVKTTTNTEGESNWSEVKAFRTADKLSEYQVATYPQVKTMEAPVEIKEIQQGTRFIDFGKDAFGQLVLTLSSDGAKDSVIVHLGECVQNGRVQRDPGKSTIRYHRYALSLMEGTHTYRIKVKKDKRNTGSAAVLIPDYVGEVLPFRYCEIEGYNAVLPTAAVVRETVHYPFNEKASAFECSNDILNQIWDLCKYSMRATSFLGIYVDGDRERIPYEADAIINQLSHYGVDREYAIARRSHEYLLQHPTWPTEWILQAITIAWYDYLYTGDSRSLKASYELLKPRVLMALREKNGLISTSTGLQTPEFVKSIRMNREIMDIVDWPHYKPNQKKREVMGEADDFYFTDYNAVTNAWHYETLRLMSQIADVLDKPEESVYYKNESENFKKTYVHAFFDNKKGYVRDGLAGDTDHASLHGNMFPLAFDLIPQNKQSQVIKFIESRGMACSVYGSQFLMDALYKANAADYALHMLTKTDDRSWYNMIKVGSTISLEAWDNKYKPNQDWNHAWGAAPANIIPRHLMGVEPLTPGFGTIRIKPQVTSLEWAKAIIPTIRGAVQMSVENKGGKYILNVTIPANMDAEVYLPLPSGKYQVTNNGNPIKVRKMKNEPFLYVGKIGSGNYTLVVE